jgi:hypothetical protein
LSGCAVEILATGRRSGEDARDAVHLARLLHLGQIVEVAIPSVAQAAARDLVRAREDCRGDLMTARHRLSKFLLRQGIVYYGGQAWTGRHELWLRAQHFDDPTLTLTYEAALDAMVMCVHRGDRLDEAITAMASDSEFTPVVRRLCCLRRGLDLDGVRVGLTGTTRLGPGSVLPDAAGTATPTRPWAPSTAPHAHGGSWLSPHAPVGWGRRVEIVAPQRAQFLPTQRC